MSGVPALTWTWRERAVAQPPRAAVAWDAVARRLHQRLQQLPATQAERLQATAHARVLVVLGAESDLPWVEGVQYAASHEQAPALWLPTRYEPEVAIDLLAQALLDKEARSLLLLWPEPAAVIPLDRQLPVTEEHLARIADYWAQS
ncbi:hypothetical protein K5F93_17230 [Pseudomonas protegens]|uniref:bpX5 domain-containing protein n=1 Tax=Pseudomonas protegens TaxID=380021 RepID=UPI001C8D23B7|nr:hypothetical protein [Pseudomonas protegens]QZI68181.1 hypothetical protein K5F93_17230 [Pseudomonas protegens]